MCVFFLKGKVLLIPWCHILSHVAGLDEFELLDVHVCRIVLFSPLESLAGHFEYILDTSEGPEAVLPNVNI